MAHYKYLIVGGGIAADAAAKGIRELDPEGTIGVVSIEPDPPYDRPPLTKGMWKGKPKEKIMRRTADKGVTLHLNTRVTKLDAARKTATDRDGNEFTYDKLLIATGGRPRRLPFGGDEVIYFRTLRDYERVRAQADAGARFTVIGGGYIGSELAASMASKGVPVTLIAKGKHINGEKFPKGLAEFLDAYYRDNGVDLRTGEKATGVRSHNGKVVVETTSRDGTRHEYEADVVVAGLGIEPNVELAQGAGLTVDNGVIVDEHLRTSAPDIYAAGDVASVHRPLLGKRMRIEHEDNANEMGRAAGRNMAGANEPFTYHPYFYSDLFDLGYEAVGELNAKAERVADWSEPNRKGVIYYLEGGRVRGVVLWNVWEKRDAARAVIAERGPFDAASVKGKIAMD